jgi:hypothetical protein
MNDLPSRLAYIYTLEDPRNPGIVRWVGQTGDPQHRYGTHCGPKGKRDEPIDRWRVDLRSLGLKPVMNVLRSVPWNERMRYEDEAIVQALVDGHPLLNKKLPALRFKHPMFAKPPKVKKPRVMPPTSEATRQKISKSLAGRKQDPEAVKRRIAKRLETLRAKAQGKSLCPWFERPEVREKAIASRRRPKSV